MSVVALPLPPAFARAHYDVRVPAVDERAEFDTALVRRVAGGDAEALRLLYERYGRIVYAFAHRFTNDATLSEEATQDTFVVLWRKAGAFDPARGRLSTWLFVVARNKAIELGRQKARRPELRDELEPVGSAPDPSALVGDADEAQTLAEAMAALPDEQLEVLRLSFFDGLSHSEIADRVGIPLGTVKGRMRLALERMRALVGDLDLVQERP
jgi:RNA polymerase sigma-70 factor (ECF subfamily)